MTKFISEEVSITISSAKESLRLTLYRRDLSYRSNLRIQLEFSLLQEGY